MDKKIEFWFTNYDEWDEYKANKSSEIKNNETLIQN